MVLVVDEVGVVVVELGAVVVVELGVVVVGAVVVVVVEPADASSSAVTMVPLGFGNFVPAGTKPTVMSWSLLKRSVPGSPWTVEGVFDDEKAFAQYVTVTTPFFPAYFVPDAHLSPLR